MHKYYRHPNTGEVFAYEADGSQDEYIKPGLVRMIDAEVEAHLAPPPIDYPAIIADRRWQAEVAGITVNGMQVDTGRDSQALITGAALQATIDPAYTVRWKTGAGFVELNSQEIIGMATAVRAHVQACFDREAELVDAVANGAFTADMLEQGWHV